jgi:hypothetical protein
MAGLTFSVIRATVPIDVAVPLGRADVGSWTVSGNGLLRPGCLIGRLLREVACRADSVLAVQLSPCGGGRCRALASGIASVRPRGRAYRHAPPSEAPATDRCSRWGSSGRIFQGERPCRFDPRAVELEIREHVYGCGSSAGCGAVGFELTR